LRGRDTRGDVTRRMDRSQQAPPGHETRCRSSRSRTTRMVPGRALVAASVLACVASHHLLRVPRRDIAKEPSRTRAPEDDSRPVVVSDHHVAVAALLVREAAWLPRCRHRPRGSSRSGAPGIETVEARSSPPARCPAGR